MKQQSKNLFYLSIILFFLWGCPEPPPPVTPATPQQEAQKLLTADGAGVAWKTNTSKKNGADAAELKDFTATFTSGKYTSSGGGDVWVDKPNNSGTWAWVGNSATSMTINGRTITVDVTATTLTLSFTIPNGEKGVGAREMALAGSYVLTLTK